MKQYASFGKRFLAFIIDSLIVGSISSFFIAVWGVWAYIGLSWVIGALYFILLEGSSWRATLGKRAAGVYVADASGNGISYGTAAVRYSGKILSALILYIGYIMAAFSDTSQALHDKLANTFVIDSKPAWSYGPGQPEKLETSHLIGISGEFAGKSFPLYTHGVLMGRDAVSCLIVFSQAAHGISRHHCKVDYNLQSGKFVINDLGSTNGTYTMAGVRIKSGKPIALSAGERFYLGSKASIFEVRV